MSDIDVEKLINIVPPMMQELSSTLEKDVLPMFMNYPYSLDDSSPAITLTTEVPGYEVRITLLLEIRPKNFED
jgi:hypothetical protein